MTKQEYLELKNTCYDIIYESLEDDYSVVMLGPFSTSLLTIKCQMKTHLSDENSKAIIQDIVINLASDLCKEGYLNLYMDLSKDEQHPNIWYTHSFKSTHEYFSKHKQKYISERFEKNL